ncbi:MAG: glutamyl-tRNA reductase [Deltaproteobacteria bacterium]|nr:glutamyl-tRNA reductase [Deltaproteobacteria bacterium]
MELTAVGINYRSAPVALRERVAFAPSRLAEALRSLMALPAVREGLILSTCNRVEIYTVMTGEQEAAAGCLRAFLSTYHQVAESELVPHLLSWRGAEAARHLFEVASGLDSMVVGEPQILGQVKSAYAQAHAEGACGLILERLLQRAFAAAKRVRSETAVARKAVSVPFAAVELVRRIFGTLEDRRVLVVGSGEAGELAARHLFAHGARDIGIVDRSSSGRAGMLAKDLQARVLTFDALFDELAAADIVVSCTAAPHAVIRARDVEKILPQRGGRPLFVVDVAVPRDVEAGVGMLPQVYLYDIDDLREIVAENLADRRCEAEKGREMIAREVERFQRWLANLDAAPVVVALRRRVEALCEEGRRKAQGLLSNATEAECRVLEAMSLAIAGKMLHFPLAALKNAGNEAPRYAQALRALFALDDEAPDEKVRPEDAASCPLLGCRVAVTRAVLQAGSLVQLLGERGAQGVEVPLITLDAQGLEAEQERALAALSSSDWLLLTSQNAVDFLWRTLEAKGLDVRALGGVRLAAVGEKTAAALLSHGLRADQVGKGGGAEGLVSLFAQDDLHGCRVLYPHGDLTAGTLCTALEAQGAQVCAPVLYHTRPAREQHAHLRELLRNRRLDVVTLASGSAAESLHEALAGEDALLDGVVVAVIGATTAAAARSLGLPVHVEAQKATAEGLVEALERHFADEGTSEFP